MSDIMAQPKTEAEWQAQSDAETLASAEQIRKDPKRYSSAIQAAKSLAEKEEVRIKALKSVARKKTAGGLNRSDVMRKIKET